MSNRIEEAITIAEALASKSQLEYADILTTEDNKCIIIINNTLLYETQLNSIPESYSSIAFKYSSVNKEDLSSVKDNLLLRNMITNSYNYYKSNCNILLAENLDLRFDEKFEELLGLKSDNGLKFYNMIGNDNRIYSIPMFAGFLNINKQDKIGIRLFDFDEKCLIVNMIIYKKKINKELSMYMRILKV